MSDPPIASRWLLAMAVEPAGTGRDTPVTEREYATADATADATSDPRPRQTSGCS